MFYVQAMSKTLILYVRAAYDIPKLASFHSDFPSTSNYHLLGREYVLCNCIFSSFFMLFCLWRRIGWCHLQ